MAMKKITQSLDTTPVAVYYQFKEPEKPHPKVKVLKKGQKFTGTYLHTFKDDAGEYQTHLFQTNEEGKITLKGCTGLNKDLATLSRNTPVEVTYLGVGKKKPGRRAPYRFEVLADTDAFGKPSPTGKSPEEEETLDNEETSAEEEFDSEVPF